MKKRDRVKTQIAAAAKLGVTVKTLQTWQHSAWWESHFKNANGFDVEAIQKANPSAQIADEKSAFDEESRRISREIRSVNFQLKQLDLQEKSGELVKLKDVLGMIAECDEAFISAMLELPIRMARLLPEGPLRKKLLVDGDSVVRDGLRSFAKQLKHGFKKNGKAASDQARA